MWVEVRYNPKWWTMRRWQWRVVRHSSHPGVEIVKEGRAFSENSAYERGESKIHWMKVERNYAIREADIRSGRYSTWRRKGR